MSDRPSLSSMLSVRNSAKAINFYKAAFGATELFRVDDGDAVVAQLSVGNSNFWLADESPGHKNFSPETLGGARAWSLSSTIPRPSSSRLSPRAPKLFGQLKTSLIHWRVGRVVDPFGHHWEIGKPLA